VTPCSLVHKHIYLRFSSLSYNLPNFPLKILKFTIAKSIIHLLQRVFYVYSKECYTFIAKSIIHLLERVLYIYCKECYTFITKSIIRLLQRVFYVYCKQCYTFIAKSVIHLLQMRVCNKCITLLQHSF
jgi:hypothetical protein